MKGFSLRPDEGEDYSKAAEGSSLKQGTSEVSGWCVFLILLSLLSLVLGAFFGLFGIPGILAAIVFALLARIAQSGRQHAEMMDAMRQLERRG
jgi:hypothetical protein